MSNTCTKCNKEHPALMPCRVEEGGSVVDWLCPSCLQKSDYCLGCGITTLTGYCYECQREIDETEDEPSNREFDPEGLYDFL